MLAELSDTLPFLSLMSLLWEIALAFKLQKNQVSAFKGYLDNALSQEIDRMESEFPFKFDALALQFKSEVLQNWFSNPQMAHPYTKIGEETFPPGTCLHKYNGDKFGRVWCV